MASKRADGEGTIFQRGNGLWVAEVSLPNGKRKSHYGKTQKEVRNWLQEQRTAVADGMWVEKENLKLADFLERYMQDIGAHTLRPKTFNSYTYIIEKHIVPELGNMRLINIRADQVQSLYSAKLRSGLSKRTVHYIHAVLHKTLHQALRWGLVNQNVTDMVDPPSSKRQKPVILTMDQAKQLLGMTERTRYHYIYLMAIVTGLREGEILGLAPADLDLDHGIVHVDKAVMFLPGKGLVVSQPKTENAVRSVKIPKSSVEEFKVYVNSINRNQKFLFSTANDTPIAPRNLLRHFHKCLELLELPILPFHSLRHLNASIQLLAGVNPKTVQERLGHSTVTLTLDTYSHLLHGVDDDAAERIDRTFNTV